jgi:hypothetical protein
MEKLHIDFWNQNDSYSNLVESVQGSFDSDFVSNNDPTRLSFKLFSKAKEIAEKIKALGELMSAIWNDISKLDVDLPVADLDNNFGGGIVYEGDVYILSYANLPVRSIEGSSYVSHIPINTYYGSDCSEYNPNMKVILTPYSSGSYILCEEMVSFCSNDKSSDMILFPGTISFRTIDLGNGDEIVGFYKSSDISKAVDVFKNDESFEEKDTEIDFSDAVSIFEHFIDHHTDRVQDGYFAPDGSDRSDFFNKYGKKFMVDDDSSSTYYELMENVPEHIHTYLSDSKEERYIKLYTDLDSLTDGQIKKPIPLNMNKNANNSAVHVDIRLIDLNFSWNVSEVNGRIPNVGSYFLSETDDTYLSYVTHSPNTFYALDGFVEGNRIVF